MKLINYLLIGLMVILVIFGIESLELQEAQHYQIESNYLDRIINNASNDAVNVLKRSVESNYSIRASESESASAVDAFITSISSSIGSDTPLTKQMVMNYMPYAVVVDDEGYSILASVDDGESQSTFQKSMTPKIKFYHQIGDNIVFLNDDPLITVLKTTDDGYDIKRLSRQDWLINTGDARLIAFFSSDDYTANINSIKRKQLISDINYYVNAHNTYAKERGIFYDFVFDDDLITCEFDSITFLAGFQGMPITAQKRLNKLVSNGFKITRQTAYVGFKQNDVLYFMPQDISVGLIDASNVIKRFETEYDAVSAGYFPYKP